MSNTISPVASSGLLGGANFDPNALTPDSLMFYLSTRMGGLDGQIESIFEKQQHSEKVRSALNELQRLVNMLDEHTEGANFPAAEPGELDFAARLAQQLDLITELDPDLGTKVRADLLSDGQILGVAGDKNDVGDAHYKGSEVASTTEYLKNVGSDLDNTAQMNMIHLQSLMSSRQTAVQLCTNLIASCADTQKAIVANYR